MKKHVDNVIAMPATVNHRYSGRGCYVSGVSLHPSPGKPASSLNAPTLRTPLPLVLGME